MDLFMIIYITGKIALAAGPLPYGEDECERRAASLAKECNPIAEAKYGCEDVEFSCEMREEAPPIAEFPELEIR